MRKPIFFIIGFLLLASALVASANVYGGEIQPLEWVDSGKVVYPGVHFTVQIHAEASRTLGGLADAAISINNLAFGFTEGGWWLDPHVILVMGGHQYDLGSIPFTKGNYDLTLDITIYCNSSEEGKSLMVVKAVNYGYEHEYLVPKDSVPIYYFEESNPALHSNVVIGRVEEFASCGDYEGELPQPGESPEEPNPITAFFDDARKVAIYVGTGIVALIGVLLVLSIYSTLRPR